MKRDNLKWALPIAVLCLLAACSKDDSGVETPAKTRTLTIGCGIGDSKADTRAGVTPGNTDKNKEAFIWHAGDFFQANLMPTTGTAYNDEPNYFIIDTEYSDNTPKNSAKFSCPDFPTDKDYRMLAFYPFVNNPVSDLFTIDFFSDQTQTGANNTRHLSKNMNMYATTTVPAGGEAPSLTFKHLHSLFRFTVTNKNSSPYRIKKIQVTSDKQVFGIEYNLKVTDWAKGEVNLVASESNSYIRLALEQTLDAKNGLPLNKDESLNAYAMAGFGTEDLAAGVELRFTLVVDKGDGTNEHNYISLALDAQKIMDKNDGATKWEPGKRYWFNLVLDHQLTVTLNSVSDMPGWDDETDL